MYKDRVIPTCITPRKRVTGRVFSTLTYGLKIIRARPTCIKVLSPSFSLLAKVPEYTFLITAERTHHCLYIFK